MKIVVTGGAGFIGSNVVDLLIEKGFEVIVIDDLSSGKLENINDCATFHKVNLCDEISLSEIFTDLKGAVVIHLAAQVSVQKSLIDPIEDARINIEGTINLMNQCVKNGISKIIYSSSAAVYGRPSYLSIDESHPINPISFYGISKLTPETYVRIYSELYGIKYTILRYANVFGMRQDPRGEGGVISIFLNNMLQLNNSIVFGNGEQTRDFIFVRDVALANMAALSKGDNKIINISSNKEISINDLYLTLSSLLNTNIQLKYSDGRPGDILRSVLNNTYAYEELSWRPEFSLEEGLSLTISYLKRELSNVF